MVSIDIIYRWLKRSGRCSVGHRQDQCDGPYTKIISNTISTCELTSLGALRVNKIEDVFYACQAKTSM